METVPSAIGFGNGVAVARTAEALLRTLYGKTILLRLPFALQVDATGANARLGIASNGAEDVVLSPAAIRAGDDGSFECTISARAVQQQVEIRQSETGETLFQSALGVVYQDKLLRITSIGCDLFAGEPYLYRLTIRE